MIIVDRHQELSAILDNASNNQSSLVTLALISDALLYIQRNDLSRLELNVHLAKSRKVLDMMLGGKQGKYKGNELG